MRPDLARSSSKIPPMRKPLSTKKMSTPRKPPCKGADPVWKSMTARTATARKPSKPGMRRLLESGAGVPRRS